MLFQFCLFINGLLLGSVYLITVLCLERGYDSVIENVLFMQKVQFLMKSRGIETQFWNPGSCWSELRMLNYVDWLSKSIWTPYWWCNISHIQSLSSQGNSSTVLPALSWHLPRKNRQSQRLGSAKRMDAQLTQVGAKMHLTILKGQYQSAERI